MVGGPEMILFRLALILLGAKLGGEAAHRLKQPPVVGEILAGIILGPSLLGLIPSFDILEGARQAFSSIVPTPGHDVATAFDLHVLATLAQLGVLLLLFEVGLESNLREFRSVGSSALLVGFLGVAISLAFGAAASYALATRFEWVSTSAATNQPHLLHLFVGATLAATSVGITARVLSDLGLLRTREARIILGAAVFDDVLVLVVLAIVGGLVVNPSSITGASMLLVLAKALGFFALAITLGTWLAPRMLRGVGKAAATPFALLGAAIIYMLAVSYLATYVGLAAIVGAFAAGLALNGSEHRHTIFEHVRPVGSLFASFFFVVLGVRVDLHQISGAVAPQALVLALVLGAVAILSKLACGWGVVGVHANRLTVGVGMVPRGEVGLIFALFGLEHGLVTNWQYATLILVVLLTTLITPVWLKALRKRFVPLEGPAPEASRVHQAMNP